MQVKLTAPWQWMWHWHRNKSIRYSSITRILKHFLHFKHTCSSSSSIYSVYVKSHLRVHQWLFLSTEISFTKYSWLVNCFSTQRWEWVFINTPAVLHAYQLHTHPCLSLKYSHYLISGSLFSLMDGFNGLPFVHSNSRATVSNCTLKLK